ncbi:MAG: hypothetical protein LBT66_04690, partial [Methanobrevibacter sp.]|nr:hypothetical protein [Candidatus Methanovirga meridionalis]
MSSTTSPNITISVLYMFQPSAFKRSIKLLDVVKDPAQLLKLKILNAVSTCARTSIKIMTLSII